MGAVLDCCKSTFLVVVRRLSVDFMHTTDVACKLSYYLRYSSKMISAWVTVTIVIERLIIVAIPLKVSPTRDSVKFL